METSLDTMTCGSFRAMCVGYNQWEFTCKWLPDWADVQECNRAKAADLIIRLQYEFRQSAPQLEVVQ